MKNTNKNINKNTRKNGKSTQKGSSHFTGNDRVAIELLLSERWSIGKVAKKLCKAKSSVFDEIKINSVKGIYTAQKAHVKARQRRWRARFQVMRIAIDRLLQDYVESRLKMFWSPEDIAGRIKFIDTNIPRIGKDAIYKYLKSPHGAGLIDFLWYKGRKRRSSTARSDIKDRTFIDERPKIVGRRERFGDWEGDFIVSGRRGRGALLVFVERKSRYVMIFKLSDRRVETINSILRMVFGQGQLLCNTLTIDNDICFRHHKQMSTIIGGAILFCHPYHSWEKGQVEKMNQMIRRFIIKGCNIDRISERKIRRIQNILNNKPYKCLGFYTPNEVSKRSRKLKTFILENFNKKTPDISRYLRTNFEVKCSV